MQSGLRQNVFRMRRDNGRRFGAFRHRILPKVHPAETCAPPAQAQFPIFTDGEMPMFRKLMIAGASFAMLAAASPSIAAPAPCRDAHGKFIK
jgi:hypothetical protein